MRKNILYSCRPLTAQLDKFNGQQLPALPHKVAAHLPVETHTQTHFFNNNNNNSNSNSNNNNSAEQQQVVVPLFIRQQQPQQQQQLNQTSSFTIQNIPIIKARSLVHSNGLKRTLTEQNIANVKRKTINDDGEEEGSSNTSKTEQNCGQQKFKWPGVHVLMESYHRYTKGETFIITLFNLKITKITSY